MSSSISQSSDRPHSDYRADVDGLRAIAVLAVLGFHGEVGLLRGGFIGVDVFFVISGYLISGIIFKALEKGTFSFAEFYVRRINRIFPALLVVLAATLAFGWPILYPAEFVNLGRHALGGAVFVSNLFLWSESGYFDSQSKPLLHLWSLGVEEQFYLLWPVVAVVAWRRKWNVEWLLVSAVAGSFLFGVVAISRSLGTAAFYSPVTRFWEILAGALLCVVELKRTKQFSVLNEKPIIGEVFGILGLAMLLTALFTVDSATPWPGWNALFPVAGTVLMIAAGERATVNRYLLANRWLVAIGLISYPLYLWHWPLMVYSRLLYGAQLPREWRVGLMVVSILLAAATYLLIERPIRFGKHKRRSTVRLLPLMSCVALIGVLVKISVLHARLDTAVTNVIERAAKDETGGGVIINGGRDVMVFTMRGGNAAKSVVFLGDSHAGQYRPRFEYLSQVDTGRMGRVDFITYGGCPPFPGVNHLGVSWDGALFRCDFVHRKALELIDRPEVHTVVYSAWWEVYFHQKALYLLSDPSRTPIKYPSPAADSLFDLFEDEVGRLRAEGKRVFIVLSNPTSRLYDPYNMLPPRLSIGFTFPQVTSVPRDATLATREPVATRLRIIAARTGAMTIDPAEYMCDASVCRTVDAQGLPIYRDDSHLRGAFARAQAGFLDQILWE